MLYVHVSPEKKEYRALLPDTTQARCEHEFSLLFFREDAHNPQNVIFMLRFAPKHREKRKLFCVCRDSFFYSVAVKINNKILMLVCVAQLMLLRGKNITISIV